ncbi:hypothetical protein NL676_015146 [Syzygium grande]|nr:hypothetical protein NL676_015146 [Syzygium grande]
MRAWGALAGLFLNKRLRCPTRLAASAGVTRGGDRLVEEGGAWRCTRGRGECGLGVRRGRVDGRMAVADRRRDPHTSSESCDRARAVLLLTIAKSRCLLVHVFKDTLCSPPDIQ